MGITLITGASSGIGQGAAVEVARRGSGVIVTYSSRRERALQTVEQVEQVGGTAVALPLDTGRAETFPDFVAQVRQVLAETWDERGLTGLVNNAGFAHPALVEDTTEDQLDSLYRVLLKGPYLLTQALLPLLADGGAIVNTTSTAASHRLGLEPGYSAYAAMKGGLVVMTRYLAKELAPRGIRVNSVAPGATRTSLGGDAFAAHPEVIEPLAARTALGRIGESQDVGRVIAFLLSKEAAWVTGQDVEASGGFNL